MDDYFGLLVLAALLFFILGPAGFFMALGARRRIDALERTVRTLETRLVTGDSATTPAAEAAEPTTTPKWNWPTAQAPASALPGAPPEQATSVKPPIEPAPALPRPARKRRSLEETFGTRWTVWVGGLALALGALLLVRYSIEAGLFGPAARIGGGLALAVALIATGEVLRRREPRQVEPPGIFDVPSIPAMLTAAGAVAAFGTVYAAHALYGFIGPGPAFIILGLVGLACMVASALHGPALSGIGLVGAFVAPALVESAEPNPWALAIYLAVLTASAYGLARLRLWLWLAMTAAAGAALWGLLLIFGIDGPSSGQTFAAAMLHLVAQAALAGYFLGWSPWRATPEADAHPVALATAGPLVFALLSIVALAAASAAGLFGSGWSLFAAAMVVVLAGAGFLVAPAAGVFAGAGLVALATARVWPATLTADPREQLPDFAADFFVGPVQPQLYIGWMIAAALAVLALGGWRMAMSRALPLVTLSLYGASAALTPLALLAVSWMRVAQGERSFAFAVAAAALGAVFVALATRFHERDDGPARFATGVFAAATIAALALALTFALDGGALVVALAMAGLGAAFVATRLDVPALRWSVAGLGLVVAARLAWEPRVIADPGATPIFNWLLYGYGVPALCFGLAARMMRRARGEDVPVRMAQALTILFSAFLVFFEIRHLTNGGDAYAATSGSVEQGLHAVAGFAFAIVLTRLDAARASPVFCYASLAFGALSFVHAVVGLGFIGNPYFSWKPVEGGAFVNALLLAYLFPAVLAFVLSHVARGIRPAWYVTSARLIAIALAFGWLTLETRRLFQGEYIGLLRATGGGEFYAYSAVWLGFGIVLLAIGLLRGSREARLASAVFVAASVLKVFLFDLDGLEGVLRALSFIGLGAVLIGIGLVYQKLVFARRGDENPADDSAPS